VASGSVYLPFGAGPRTCIGNQQALHQMALVTLLVTSRGGMHQLLDAFGAT
jgi:cytochrome P450